MFLFPINYLCPQKDGTMNKSPLLKFGNIPIGTQVLYDSYSNLASPSDKVRALEKSGDIIKLKRGLYVVSSDVTGKLIDVRLCANHIYGPSYVSLQWALRWYGLIPERVHIMSSMTTLHTRRFENKLGIFEYFQVPPAYFSIGLRIVEEDDASCIMASPEKALCDSIIHDLKRPPQSIRGLVEYLEEFLRFDMDALADFDINVIEECAACGQKTRVLQNIIKIIKRL